MTLYAHTTSGPQSEWEPLEAHLKCVADRAEELARKFGAADFGRAAGLLHDLGKAKPEWQQYLLRGGASPTVGHAAEGALAACKIYRQKIPRFNACAGRLLAYVIAGHHAGLANGVAAGGGLTPLDERLKDAVDLAPLLDVPKLGAPPRPLGSTSSDAFAWSFFVRMLFSTLIDADRRATEAFDETAHKRLPGRETPPLIATLKPNLDAFLATAFASADVDPALTQLRAEVQADCRAAAAMKPGHFSLTVPTGGGKTLSSLAFAIDHAVAHQLDRVISVIPFTSIIDQTADVFRKAIGAPDAILEHHSAFDDEKFERSLGGEADIGQQRRRLATQNWDRPIVVTTAVQFFESLFANSPKRCRKLHSIARSVIVLDEAQTLPVKLLRPCLAALKELVRGYGCSVVFCTATQPALTKEAFVTAAPASLPPREMLDASGVREIIGAGRNLFNRLDRVAARVVGPLSDADVVSELASVEQGLVIVDNRRHARYLFTELKKVSGAGARHLTTAMTAAHRQSVLADVRADLKAHRPVRLVSTSLIEAGVDVSFSSVWRARAGVDQIVQAGGRCNRNGELGHRGGRLFVFTPEDKEGHGVPPELRRNADAGARVLATGVDPMSPEAVSAYFAELLWLRDDDGKWAALDDVEVGGSGKRGIMSAIADDAPGLHFRFADIAAAFRLIDTAMVPVIIPHAAYTIDGAPDAALLDQLKYATTAGGIARQLQRHIVQIPRRARDALIKARSAVAVAPDRWGEQFVVLSNAALYTAEVGLNWDDPTVRDLLVM